MRDAVFAAEGDHRTIAIPRVAGFQASGRVIDTGVNHSAVPPGLMTGDLRLLLQDDNAQTGLTSGQV